MKTPLFALPDAILIPTVQAALLEDLGRRGDVTSAAVIAKNSTANLAIVSRDTGILAGMDLARLAFECIDKQSTLAQMPQMGILSNQVKCWLMYRAIPKPYYKLKEQH